MGNSTRPLRRRDVAHTGAMGSIALGCWLVACSSSRSSPGTAAPTSASSGAASTGSGMAGPSTSSSDDSMDGAEGGTTSGATTSAASDADSAGVVDAQPAATTTADGSGNGAATAPLAATPPLGWNSYNTFGCNISESLLKATADAMVTSGMRAAGFEYVNLDDCWMDGRDAAGTLHWNASKFPSGIPALAEYVHGRGLKLGIYETPNTVTCVGIYKGIAPSVAVGSLGHEAQDARTFAAWGIDYLKYDLCRGQLSSFAVMRDALRATGRPIVYSINPGNSSACPPTGPTTSTCGLDLPSIANLWRIGFDINASWSSITGLIDQDAPLAPYASPGHWNDPDMLEVGNGSLSEDESQSHFSMWAMLAAPLLAGNDLRSMPSAVQTILTNTEIIAVDQDPLGKQATLVATPRTGLEVWSKTLSGNNARAVALLNRNAAAASISVTFGQIGLSSGPASVRDMWQHAAQGTFNGSYTAANVPSHGVAMLRIEQ
jgi:alpha-galactosidase